MGNHAYHQAHPREHLQAAVVVTQDLNTPEKDTRPIAFFDIDGTLTTSDTLMPFLKYVVGARVYYAKLFLIGPVLIGYFAKLIPNDIAKQIILKFYLKGYHIDEVRVLGRQFSEEMIPEMVRPDLMERLKWHQELGHQCVLVSASLDIYLNDWCKKVGITACLCSSLEVDSGSRITGALSGSNCFGAEKARRILINFESLTSRYSYAYGDSKGDLAMLFLVNSGFLYKKGKIKKVER